MEIYVENKKMGEGNSRGRIIFAWFSDDLAGFMYVLDCISLNCMVISCRTVFPIPVVLSHLYLIQSCFDFY